MTQPNLILVSSVVLGVLTTFFIILALSSESWEHVTFDVSKLRKINGFVSNESILSETDGFFKVVIADTTFGNKTIYLVRNTFSGLWTLCDTIPEAFRQGNLFQETLKAQNEVYIQTLLGQKCFNYIMDYQSIRSFLRDTTDIGIKSESLFRMHNSAASCGIVSVLCLFTALITGSFGLWQRQVSATMVTGVMYAVAGVFLCFTLIITLTKVGYQQGSCYSLETITEVLCRSRAVHHGWSEPIAWVGFSLSVIALGFWLLLARFFRIETAKSLI